MKLRKLLIVALAALVALSLASAAVAARRPTTTKPAGITGIWVGKTHQDLEPLGDDADFVEWVQPITVTAWAGRLASLAVNVRYLCPHPTNPGAGDIRLNLSWSTLKRNGPLLTKNGGFSLVVTEAPDLFTNTMRKLRMPLHIRGVLGKGGAGGRFDLSGAGCSGKGSWLAKRKR